MPNGDDKQREQKNPQPGRPRQDPSRDQQPQRDQQDSDMQRRQREQGRDR